MKYLLYIICFLFTSSLHANKLDTVPQTMNIGHVSSSWDGIEYADASAGISFIETPIANVTGNAVLSYPIDIPVGRQNMQPSLSVNYDSESTSTWLGFGWNLGVSSISLDTRWGVPTYSAEIESEIYLLDGEQMGPVFHRAAEYPREAERSFVLRQTTEFQTIIRHGDAATNYWWEVIEKDGVKKYYGGTPETGLSTPHVLSFSKGITEWMLMKTIDPNGNNILYNYQKVIGAVGVNIYPASIVYTGHENSAGNYMVQFSLHAEARQDITSNGRLGFLVSNERLLARIDVLFNAEQIRAYTFQYTTGAFGKTMLEKIEVLDANNAFFYDYSFDYFNDIENSGSAYTSTVDWDVPKDNIDIQNITGNIDGFNGKPTILGSANSQSIGFSSSITVGLVTPPHTKDFTVGPNGGYTNNSSEGITAFLDMNGDGLPDKVWKEDDFLFYRPNLFASGVEGFGDKTLIQGVKDFSLSNTNSWNLGAELNIPPVYAGYTHEEGTAKTTTYFVDFNGDELMDIVYKGDVLFNHLENGHPVFTQDVNQTPSIIYKGVGVDPSLVVLDPDELAQEESNNPLNDAVRVWRAPYDGNITIDAPVQLIEDTSLESQEYTLKDGIRVSIQVETLELWDQVIAEDDFSEYTPTNVSNIAVESGDMVYFRVHSIYDGLYDEVTWNPRIEYSETDYLDANNKSTFVFDAEEDFLLSENRSLGLISDGQIEIQSQLLKPLLSDDVTLRIEGGYELEWTIDMNELVDSTWILSDIPVSAGDNLKFSVYSSSNVALNDMKWEPTVIYTSFDNGSSTVNDDGEPVFSECGAIDFQGYPINLIRGNRVDISSSDSIDLYFILNPAAIANFDGYASIKLKGDVDSTFIIPITGGVIDQVIQCENFETVYVDVYYQDESDDNSPGVLENWIKTNEGTLLNTIGFWRDNNFESGLYGHMYRGWGQFLYNGNDGRGNMPIILDGLEIDEDEVANDTLQVDEDAENTDLEGTGNNGELIVTMTSDSKLMAWRGSDEFAFVASSRMGSSRKGKKNLTPPSFNTGSGDFFTAPELIAKYYSNGGFGGLGVPGTGLAGSAGYTAANSYSVLDVVDFNGDRYPDVISETNIQYTNFRGGLTDKKLAYEWGIHESFSEAVSIGIGLNPGSTSPKNAGASMGAGSTRASSRVKQKSRANASKARSSFESASEAVGLSASVGEDNDRALHTFMDLNGDALEDKVWENGDVAINLGYDFAPIQNWGFNVIRSGDALDIGAGLGINVSNGSILGGVSATKTINGSKEGFVDLNGDALPDLIISTDPIVVQFNTGNDFTAPVTWLDVDAFDAAESLGESVNAGFTFPIIFFWFKIAFNIQGFTGQGTGNVYQSFQDINGDGFVDFLSAANSDDNLKAQYSTIGRTNLLRNVHYPLGALLTLNYKAKGNNSNLPYTKWTMTETTMYDGVEGDGSDFSHRSFDYKDGKHDRHERQFLGFEEVVTNFHSGDLITKKLVQEYQVDNYYTKGLLSSIELYDEKDVLHKAISFTYEMRDIETGVLLPANYLDTDNGMLFPALSQQTVLYTEGLSSLNTQETIVFEYDLWGNITKQQETDINGYDKQILWTYAEDNGNGIKNRITQEQILGGSQLLRESSKSYDQKGNNTEISSKINASDFAVTTMEYDMYGNLIQVTKPENYIGEMLEMNLIYDDVLQQYNVRSTDNYGYVEEYEYEFFFGTLTSYTDKNGQVNKFGVDPKGRPAFHLNPVDANMGNDYSKRYTYELNAAVPNAVCLVKNPSSSDDIKTYAFYDGLHRMIQSKQVAITSNGQTEKLVSIVSGMNKVDSLGRVVEEFLEIEEAIGSITSFNPTTSSISPIEYSYDLNDRVTNITHIDGGMTSVEYSIQVEDGQTLLLARQQSPNGLITEMFYSTRGELVTEKQIMPGEESVTSYRFNVLSGILSINHPSGNETEYTYDMLGRRITVDVPDAGLTELVYDKAGNLIEKITANVRDGLQENAAIRYNYDKERLLTIDYPKNFQNKVEIHYGDPDALYNRKGRIWLQEDATGGREYFYDVFGNVTKEIRTVIVNRSEIYTYVTEFEHDALNRVVKLIYPDGEVLEYSYDETGRLDKIVGSKATDEYVYVDNIHYDFYLERIKMEYGNGVEEVLGYDDKGRLNKHSVEGNSTFISDTRYAYDLEDHVVSLENPISSEFIGAFNIETSFDEKGRIVDSQGDWSNASSSSSYQSFFDYNPTNTLSLKSQEVVVDDVVDDFRSRTYDYIYEDPAYPTRPSQVAGRDYAYDFNGNLSLVNSQTVFDFSQYIYDEENRLMGASENGNTSLYTYDAFGRRTLKSQGSIQGIFINGAPAGLVEHLVDYRVDVSPYFTVFEDDYRKHIFMDHTRIASKIGTGIFLSNLSDVPEITAGGIDYKARIQAYEQQILSYYASIGVPPGPPTLLALLGQPEINQVGFDDIDSDNPYSTVPPNWPDITEPDSTGPPGAPVFYVNDGTDNANVKAGYNFASGSITKELEQFYFHYDVQMNVHFMTGSDGLVRQYNMYLPSGETWVSDFLHIDASNYAMGGLLFDEETQMYYMGEIYYDPVSNVELSVDKLEQTFGVNTVNSRIEGNLYYDFADFQDNVAFDLQIVNSEKPSPYLVSSGKVVDFVDYDDDDELGVDFTKSFNAFTDEQPDPFISKTHPEVKKRRRAVTIAPGSKNAQTFDEFFEAFEIANLQSPEGFNPSDDKAFKGLVKQVKKNRIRKENLKNRKKNNKLKVRFR